MSDNWVIASRRMVAEGQVGPGFVRVRAGRIADVHLGAAAPAGAIDIGDLVLMPGVVDTHVHVNEPGRTDWEGFETAGRAAAAGGVTTMVVMPLNCSPVATTVAALQAEADAAAVACLVDYGFWGGVIPGNHDQLAPLWEAGVLGYKAFLVHSGIDEFPGSSESDLDTAMSVLSKLTPGGAVLLAHAEDPATIAAAAIRSGLDQSPSRYLAYLASRPAQAEVRAIEMMIRLALRHHSRVHIVHVAAADALPVLREARAHGLPVTTETCPHYLAFAAEEITDGRTEFEVRPADP